MITIVDLRTKGLRALPHDSAVVSDPAVERSVARILADVRDHGDAALKRYSRRFDGVTVNGFRVPQREIARAYRTANPRFLAILRHAANNIRRFHEKQKRNHWRYRPGTGADLRQLYLPIESAGVYVPGGKAAYPSTVLMNVIPAQIAGVSTIRLVSPPDRTGNVHRDVLTAAAVLGIDEVYRIGGAQAIAALTFGTRSIPAVDKIVGPGNMYVATAKRLVYGTVGIDSVAGPSEVVILADDTADPLFVASDMLAQAEHDERAMSVLITPSRALAAAVDAEVRNLVTGLPRRSIITASLRNRGSIVIVRSIKQGIDAVNALAPEHLQIITRSSEKHLRMIKHAGSIFMGNDTPVAVGDYFAGPNHVLPTGRTARFSSPLSVDDFIKRSSVTRYSRAMMERSAETIAAFADHEGLSAHALSLRLRGPGKQTI